MKTREEIRKEVAALGNKYILLSMPTGLGKTFTALAATYRENTLLPLNVLIVYPKLTIEDSWRKDIEKWGYQDKLPGITFTTYNSLQKHADKVWDMIIFDEGHHITERVLSIIEAMKYKRALVLSATIKPSLRYQLATIMPGMYLYKVTMKDALDNLILPDPRIIRIPLQLNMRDKTQLIVKNKQVLHKVKEIPFDQRGLYKDRTTRYIIPCTEAQRNLDYDQQVDWYKRRAEGNPGLRNLWLHTAGERLKWLAITKTRYVQQILDKLQKERTLTFCASIEQTEEFGSNCIHSKNKKMAQENLRLFNENKINHITACAMLDEGVNLTSCRVGIFANLNSSERLQIQRVGRILRHERPIIILPYFKNSREEEIVDIMLSNYNKELITELKSINDLTLD